MNPEYQKDNLYKAFGSFIEAFRPYVVSVLMEQDGDRWPALFVESLYPQQKEAWNLGLKQGTSPEALIDYGNLKSFALKYKDLLKADFGKDANKLPTRLETIYDVRNKLAHFQELTTDEVAEAFISMKSISRSLKMADVESELTQLQEGKIKEIKTAKSTKTNTSAILQPWFMAVRPHSDIRNGRLDESVFAANLAEVALGNGREIYNNPVVFFSKTYLTAGLKNVAKTVIKGLNGKEDAENRIISLQTGFGGGKTHTLISLYHISKWGKKAMQSEYAHELLAYTGNPEFESANIAVFTNSTNDAANGRLVDGITIQTMWGELAYQLGGKEAYEIVRKNDEQLISPAGLFKKVLALTKPALILVDELADYCVKASARKAGNSSLADQTISFMQELTEAVAATEHCVAVITLPASPQEVGNTPEAQNILTSLQKRVSRMGADTQPVADDEIYEVIRRRLFEEVADPEFMETVASKYLELYQQYWTELPGHANKSEYKQRIIKSYPFHPELIDVFRVRWASHHDFQRTRGALRLLAAIVSDLYKRQQSLPGSNLLIHSGEVNFANLDAMSGQLKKLYGNGYDAVISADVAGASSNAFKIDGNKTEYGQWYLTQGIASVILMSSFGSDGANKGVSVPEIKLHLLTPGGFNHNNINGALDELESAAYYLYYAQTGGAGKRYWFHTKPNVNILINQAKADIKLQDIESEILKRIKDKTSRGIELFHALVDPSEDIPEQQRPTLVILSPKYLANPGKINGNTLPLIEKLATKKGNSERVYRNTMLFLVCTEIGIGKLQSDVRDYLACTKINLEYSSQLEKEQREDIRKRIDEAGKQAEVSIVGAYSVIVKYSVKNGPETITIKNHRDSLDSQLNTNFLTTLKDEEWLLESVGMGVLRNHKLLPTPEQSIRTKDIYEAFIRFDDKPMVTGPDAISKSLLRYCMNNEFCIAAGEEGKFNKYYLGENVPFFDVTDTNYWLVDKSLKPAPEVKESEGGTISPPPTVDGKEGGGGTITPPVIDPIAPRNIKSVTISGKVGVENYTQLFASFVMPLAQNGVEIEIRIKGKSTSAKPLTENSQEYKVVKESARQLGLRFEEE
ncbi:MAG: DUF499 domain-containing protein [Flavobacteriales bacterium]|nr:DUF499 domain-containing protein [Flavobacteriales bacterium]